MCSRSAAIQSTGIVYTQIVPDVSARTLKSIIKQKVNTESTVFSGSWKSCHGLVFYGYEHIRVNHDKELIDRHRNHINGIESFWVFVKNKLTKFYGIHPKHFYLFLKEYEFRFNNRNQNINELLQKIINI